MDDDIDTAMGTKDSGALHGADLPAGARLLRVWELIGATMTITYGFELDGFLHGELLRRAWVLVQRQVPYAATSIQAGSGGGAHFVLDPQASSLRVSASLSQQLYAQQQTVLRQVSFAFVSAQASSAPDVRCV